MDMRSVKTAYFPLKGGLNVVSPPMSISDGMCRDAVNYDCDIDGGYRYISGYERFDGRPQPSDALYYSIPCTFSGTVASNDLLTGATSGATGRVIAFDASHVYITKLTGTFTTGENLLKSGSAIAVTTNSNILGGAPSSLLNAQYRVLAANIYRADITAVTGSGPIRGVWRYNGVVYAFRDNAGATKGVMWKSTSSGWAEVTFDYEVAFSAANTDVNEGDTLTQGAVTATIIKVIVETGTLASGTNTGKLIITAPSSSLFAVGAATTTGTGAVQLTSTSSQMQLAAGGKYSFINYNFAGGNTLKMYGANGVNRAFEFDGTRIIFIKSGMAIDTPKHITAHVNRLFLTFDNSLQYSSVGAPYSFSAVIGAGEIAMGDEITGLQPLVGSSDSSALAVFTKSKTSILYGTSTADFSLVVYSYESGAYPYSVQSIGQIYVMDELGVRQIAATQGFGNFLSSQITKYLKPILDAKAGMVVGSAISRQKNQYRIYFSDKAGLHITVDNDKIVGVMPIQTSHTFNCLCSLETGDGDEFILAGGTDGVVYRLDRGTNFDGSSINAYMMLAFNHSKSPRTRKRYRKAVYEVTGSDYSEFRASYELGYGSSDISQGTALPYSIQGLTSNFGAVFWDAFTWDNFYWDGKTLLPVEQGLTGTAENISLVIRSDSTYIKSFVINSVIMHYSDGRQLR